jgi:anti-sigma28 factor (negative regulator of flagellin synthesis)
MVDLTPLRPFAAGSTRPTAKPAAMPQRPEAADVAVVNLFQTLPATDVAKVAAIKAAIAQGNLIISPIRIAQAILADRSGDWA